MNLLDDFFLESNPNPERKGCPDEGTLKALAEDKLPDSDPARLHLAACSECFAEFRAYRSERMRARRRRTYGLRWAVAASLVFACGLGEWAYQHHVVKKNEFAHVAQMNAPQDARVDLSSAGTLRGAGDQTNELQRVSLQAAVVRLHIILPRFSQSGRYGVRVSNDKSGALTVAAGDGEATEANGTVALTVTLDLRGAKPGRYFLATVRGSDNGTYYYPLKIE